MTYGSQAAAASQVFAQQRDLALRDRADQQLELVTEAARPARRRDVRDVRSVRPADRARPARGPALGRPLHRLPAPRRAGPLTGMTTTADPSPTSSPSTTSAPPPSAARGSPSGRRSCRSGRRRARRYLKAESLQPIGAFKLRGAYVAVASLAPEALRRGVITYSSGNHAQGVARAARLLGAPAVVVMPSDAPAIKRERVAADGAQIVIVGNASEERREVAEAIAAERGLSIIPPYDDDRIIAGQGTVGLELVEDLPDLAAVLVPIGGGGLASGVATAVRALRPEAPGHRRRARAGRRRPRLAGGRRDRRLARRARLADDRRRHADAGARAPGPSPTCAPTWTRS